MAKRNYRYFVGDFETTVYEGQSYTEVWASASVELYTENVMIFHSIDEQFKYFLGLNSNIICWYHNLKFDGSFWLSYLLLKSGFKQAYVTLNDEGTNVQWLKKSEMPNKSFRYTISDMGQWYSILIKYKNKYIEFRDSLKLLPFSVKKIGESFGTKHKKLDMKYEGFRYSGCEITDEERQYISNDVLVVKEAMEILLDDGHNKLTIGSCCMEEFKRTYDKLTYQSFFPALEDIQIDPNLHTYETADAWIRKSYKGGWCYVVPGKSHKVLHNGCTADVNSLYPAMMHSDSGNIYPVGMPYFWYGNYIPKIRKDEYYFVRIRTRFYLKQGYLPFIQIKGNPLYNPNQCLTTSDVFDRQTGLYCRQYIDLDGNTKQAIVELTLTMTDYELFQEHYKLVDSEIIDGVVFRAEKGIYDEYIDKYRKIKVSSTGAKRQLAKLFSNNLYGKQASNTDSTFKVAYVKEDMSIGFFAVPANDKKAGFIACGSAITSYARCYTIRTAQANYHGADKPGFCYADTDSIHCDIPPSDIKGIEVHPTKYGCWKLESTWDIGYFVRQKTYIEHVIESDLKPVEPFYNVKCAGMPDKCKDLFIKSMTGYAIKDDDEFTPEEIEFISKKRDLKDFDIGLVVPSKLRPVRIRGGIVLVSTTYKMRKVR